MGCQFSVITRRSEIAVTSPDPALASQVEKLAARLDLAVAQACSAATGQYRLLLRISDQGLELITPHDPNLNGSVRVDFISGRTAYRRKQGKKELLLRAVGCKGKTTPAIMDGTGGLGGDSFILAAAGCRVRIFERQPIIAALLANGLERAAAHPETAKIVRRIQLTPGDVVTTLLKMQECGEQADVVYLDPMFPERRKSALVKKELRLLQLLAPIDSSPDQLLTAAIRAAANRVVVKRPIKAPVLTGLSPSHSLRGKTVRFDVYVIGSIPYKRNENRKV
ncbi:MAG: hypothetical protein D3924_18135 [Candidatus Electrothrix sp. AR4]|nr:hypothetical protein [Candidatus Electrothrix sp. AR4]